MVPNEFTTDSENHLENYIKNKVHEAQKGNYNPLYTDIDEDKLSNEASENIQSSINNSYALYSPKQ